MKHKEIKCKLTEKDEKAIEEVNKIFQEFKKQYTNADSKKDFFRVNNIKDNDSVIYNLKLIFDLFNWGEITIEKINKVAKEYKKKPEHLLNTICRRIEMYRR